MERFPYEQVIGKELVRILTLEPGESNDTVISSLEIIDMKHAENAEFVALAYAWGVTNTTQTFIFISYKMPRKASRDITQQPKSVSSSKPPASVKITTPGTRKSSRLAKQKAITAPPEPTPRLEPASSNDAELASLMQEPGKESAGTLASGAADEPTEGPVPEVVQEPIQSVAEEPTEERVQEFVWESTPLLGVPEEVADVPTSADDSALTRYNTVAEDVVHHCPSSGDDGIPNKEQHAADNSVTPADTPALEEDANVDYQNMCMQSIEEFLMWPPTEEVPPSPSSGNTTEKAETPEQYREEQVSADAAVGEGTQRKLTPQPKISDELSERPRKKCMSFKLPIAPRLSWFK
ncbi:MAG: hypothetical protein Q9172_000872 [Xanthocarpia lactea]